MKRGIYLLPNLITLSGMLCGFYSIIQSIEGNFHKAALFLIAAGIFDVLDGKIARLTKTTSQFGVEMDSLADLLSFGIAPAILILLSTLESYGKAGWMASFIYIACGAMRLARHNIIAKNTSDKSFVGLPIPAAAGVILSYIIFVNSPYADLVPYISQNTHVVTPIIYLLSILMVSNIPYHSFKEFEVKKRKPFSLLIIFGLGLFTIIQYYRVSLFIISLIYALSGPIEYFLKKLISKNSSRKEVSIKEAT